MLLLSWLFFVGQMGLVAIFSPRIKIGVTIIFVHHQEWWSVEVKVLFLSPLAGFFAHFFFILSQFH
jgi:hypothetical protein